ncbi:MAG: radical SAM protein [Acidimicrobiia bacterium]|nr:radical SAM protein [Acidimicrobiia bacterium]
MNVASRFLGEGVRPDFDQAPLTVAWEITRSCPLRCVHCRAVAQVRRDPDELSIDEGTALIADAADMGTKVFVLTGGDPLARPDVFDLIEAVEASGMHCGFSPSTTPRLTADALGRAVDAGAGTIHLSLDGASAATHDAFRGVRGSFERAMSGVGYAAELDARLQVGTTVCRRTVGDLEAIVPLLEGRVDLWSLFFLVPTGRGRNEDVLDAQGHEEILEWLATADLPVPVRTVAAPTFRRVLAEAGRPAAPGVNDGNGFAFVSHRGEVCPSGFLQLPVGTVREQPLSHWYRDDPLFRSLRDTALLEGTCGACEWKEICGGSRARAWATTGNPLAADPSCIRVADSAA